MSRIVYDLDDEQLRALIVSARRTSTAIEAFRDRWPAATTAAAREQLADELVDAGARLAVALVVEAERMRRTPRRPRSTPRPKPSPVTKEQAAQHCADLVDALPPHPSAGRRPPQFVNRQPAPYVAPAPIPTEAEWTAPTCGTCGARIDPVMGRPCGCP